MEDLQSVVPQSPDVVEHARIERQAFWDYLCPIHTPGSEGSDPATSGEAAATLGGGETK